MNSTKLMFLGILIMLAGFALNARVTQLVAFRAGGSGVTDNLAYIAVALFGVGFVLGVFSFFRN